MAVNSLEPSPRWATIHRPIARSRQTPQRAEAGLQRAVGAVRRTLALQLPEYPQVPLLLTLLFSAYVVGWYLQVGGRWPALGALRFEFLLGAALAAIAIVRGMSLRSPLTGYLFALLACMAIQVPLSYDVATSTQIFVDRVLKFSCLAIFIVAFVQGPRQLKWFMAAFLLACLKMGQEGFVGQWTGSMVWENQGVMRLHGGTSLYGHPNSFAGMAVGTLPFVFYLFPVASRLQKVALLVMAVFAANIILFTGSRTGYVALFAVVACLLLKARRKVRAIVAALVIGAVLLPAVPQDYVERFQSIFTMEEREGRSAETRRQILEDAWQVFLWYPLGVGVSAFPAVREEAFGRTQDTHNLYLEVATNLGVQGLIVFALFVIMQLRLLSRLSSALDRQIGSLGATGPPAGSEHAQPWSAHLADLRLMRQVAHAVQVFVIARLALGMFGMDLYEIYWWFAMGLVIALYRMEQVAEARTEALVAATGAGGSRP